jgi:hypothetical protein
MDAPARPIRLRRRLLLAITLVALVALGYQCWRAYDRAQLVRADLRALQAVAGTQRDRAMLSSLGVLLAKTRGDTAALRAEAGMFLPITHYFGWVPVYGADLVAAEPLLDTAADLARAADESFRALSPIVLDRKADRPIGVAMMQQLIAARPQIAAARQATDRAAAAWAGIQLDALDPALRGQLLPIAGMLAALRDGLDLSAALPGMLGEHGPVHYILLAQNPDELRATGGFIGSVGILTLDHGAHNAIEMQNSATVDDLAHQVYPDPPQPLLRYMNSEMWLFRDSNWSPDFPTSAKLARQLYALGQRREYANVIAFDPLAVEQLLAAIGPVTIAESSVPISAKNVADYLRSEHDLAQGTEKKAYIGRLANAVAAQIESRPGQIDLWKLLAALQRVLNERHLQFALADTTVAPIAARHGWDGAVQPGAADFLMVVDSNVGYNKVNPNISQAISYTIDLSDPSAPMATLEVRYIHTLKLQDTCKQFDAANNSYADWMRRCYYDYLRVLVPHGSQLVGATTQPVPDAWMDSGAGDDGGVAEADSEAGTRVLSTFVVVPFGQQRMVSLRYRLPAAVLTRDAQGWHYRLRVQKQAGTDALPLTIELRLSARATVVAAIPLPSARTNRTLHFAANLAQDRTFEVTFQP